jgi:tetratricopeptide (TPR) repeat protein
MTVARSKTIARPKISEFHHPKNFVRGVAIGCLVFSWLPIAQPLLAQSTLRGTVVDPQGQPIPGAKVTVRPLLDDTLRFSVETKENGHYTLENFNPSKGYRFTVAKEGCRSVWRDVETGISGTSVGGVLRQNFVLYPVGLYSDRRDSKLVLLSRYSPAAGLYQKAQRSLERGELEKALKRFEAAQELDQDLAPIYEGLAIVYHQLGHHENAVTAADKALELAPGDPDFLRVRYDALTGLGRREEARKTLLHLAETTANPATANPATATLFLNEGVEAVRGGDRPLAEAMLQGALRLDPGLKQAQDALAKVYIEDQKYESAAAMVRTLLQDDPSNTDYLRISHQAFTGLGDADQARLALQALIHHDPGPRTATLLYNQGVEAFNGGRDEAAEGLFQTALQLNPKSRESRLGLAEVYLRQRRFDLCLEALEPILVETPGDVHAGRIRDRAVARMNN